MKLSIAKSLIVLACSGMFFFQTVESVQAEENQTNFPNGVEYFWDLSTEEQVEIDKDVKLQQLVEAKNKVEQRQKKWKKHYHEAEERHTELKKEKEQWSQAQKAAVEAEKEETFLSKIFSQFPLVPEKETDGKEKEDMTLEDFDYQLTTIGNELRIIAAQLERVKNQSDELTQFREDIITNSAIEKAAYEEMKNISEEIEEEDIEIEEQTEEQIEEKKDEVSSRKIFDEPQSNELVAQAVNLIGIEYVFGGSSQDGFDSSGLVEYIFKETGFDMQSTVSSQLMQVEKVNQIEMQPGDLVFFNQTGRIDHVGIYLGNDEFISAQPTKGVVVENIQSDYWFNNLSSVGRVS
ncbi:C40 family peptidase [Lacticigenium naphthae]|uniref:C40 family peptidase n=1 Tax=Lacticigenium naphthae TaxID=515351 RepID=UPI0004264B6A|nr:C40 family peptidase [Lacticigenium naphthae]